MSEYTRCYTCGEQGHYSRECKAVAVTPEAGQLGQPAGRQPWEHPVPPRRRPGEIADAEEQAEKIRLEMGWQRGGGQAEEARRNQALEQVAESRRERGAELDALFTDSYPEYPTVIPPISEPISDNNGAIDR